MVMFKMVSIIIPTYNSKEFLPKTVESALKQTYKPVEIITNGFDPDDFIVDESLIRKDGKFSIVLCMEDLNESSTHTV
jgi:GT2 family glycosyltransferase